MKKKIQLQKHKKKFFIIACILFPLFIFGIDKGISYYKYYYLKQHSISKKDIPGDYQFLLFPKQDREVFLYKTKKTSQQNRWGRLKRAVLASYNEIQAEIIQVVINDRYIGFVKRRDLTYLPQENKKKLIEGWQKKLHFQGFARGEWVQKKYWKGQKLIFLKLFDSKHIRYNIYGYVINDDKLISVKSIFTKSGVEIGSFLLLVFYYFLAVWFFGRIIFRDW